MEEGRPPFSHTLVTSKDTNVSLASESPLSYQCTMDTTLVAVGILALGLVAVTALGIFLGKTWAKPLIKAVVEGSQSVRWAGTEARLEALEKDVERLPRVWEEFADDARKAQGRAQWHVKRIKKELQERGLQDDEIDSLGSSLRPIDGDGGNGSGLPSLQAPMEEILEGAEDAVTLALKHKWGRHGQ